MFLAQALNSIKNNILIEYWKDVVKFIDNIAETD